MATDVTLQALQKMTGAQLDELFSDSSVDTLPHGPMDGTVLLVHPKSAALAKLVHAYLWRGKTFDAINGVLYNRFPHADKIYATMRVESSLYDHADCLVLDYSESKIPYVRDELRQVGPQLYLGKVYKFGRPVIHFALSPATTNDDDTPTGRVTP